ncbi:MAG: hypothetical protein Q7U57_09675 [Methylovulum sp.]|nr:hypothetical protein [Methylovulum sp.]
MKLSVTLFSNGQEATLCWQACPDAYLQTIEGCSTSELFDSFQQNAPKMAQEMTRQLVSTQLLINQVFLTQSLENLGSQAPGKR